MTGSMRSPLWMFPLPDGYPGDLENKILLRGGAKIKLQKCPDRFTVRLVHPIANLAQWAGSLGCELDRELPSIGQISLRVEVDRLESVMAQLRRPALRGTDTRAAEAAFVSHAYYRADSRSKSDADRSETEVNPSEANQPIFYLTDQIALQFQPQVTAQQIEAIIRAVGLEVLKLIPGIPKAFVYQLTSGAIVNPLKLANRLIYHPDVLLAEPNVAVAAFFEPPSERSSDANQGTASQGTANQRIVTSQRTINQGARSIVVAVVDRVRQGSFSTRGIDLTHPAFSGMGKIVAPLDLSAANLRSADAALEQTEIGKPAQLSWGTICAQAAIGEGLASGSASGLTIDAAPPAPRSTDRETGIAPGCSLMPIAIDPVFDDSAIEQILDWGVRQGAAVVCGAIPDDRLLPSLRQRVAVQRAAAQGRNGKGCVVLVQAGSAWDALPDVLPVEIAPDQDDRTQAIAMGIAAGLAAQVLAANPDLTAEEARQIVQQVHAQSRASLAVQSYDIPAQLEMAVSLALRRVSQSAAAHRIGGSGLQVLAFEDRSPQTIPDGDDRGILIPIPVQQTGIIRSVEVNLTIEHSFLGDLKIWLIPPVGDPILLQDRTLGRLTHLNHCYGLTTTPHLRSLLGRSAPGVWQLQICDCAPAHQGILREWQLRLGIQQPNQMS